MDIRRILLATTNPGKLREIRAVMFHPSFEIYGLGDLDRPIEEPVEDGDTFEQNAVKKARHYARHTKDLTLAEDSGLVVDALGGEPGVHSARYSGQQGGRDVVDPANNAKLIDAMRGVPPEKRTARFVCAMALATPPGVHFAGIREDECIVVHGTVEGRILTPEEAADPQHPERGRGTNGFGYDPLFFVPSLGKTTAELSPQEKNQISHRGEATRKMWMRLQDLIAAPQA